MADTAGPRAVHPPFFALHAPLAVYAANVSLIAWPAVVKPAAAILLGVAVVWGAVSWLTHSARQGAAAASAAVFATFAYGPLVTACGWSDDGPLGIAVWALFAGLAAWGAARLARAYAATTSLLNVAGLAMCSLALGSIAVTRVSIGKHLHANPTPGPAAAKKPAGPLPDVVLIVLDGYGRTDTFERLYGFSNQEFVDALRRRGFYVAQNAHSNYSQTELSLASTLNLHYIQDLVPPGPTMEEARGILDGLIQHSEVSRRLKSIGYKTIAITTGFPALRFEGTDLVLGFEGGNALFLDALLEKTPFRRSNASRISQFDQRRDLLRAAFDHLAEFGSPSAAPRFILVHILAPHPPFVFGAHGEEVRPKGPFGLWDGNHYMAVLGNVETYRDGYREQAQYIAEKTLRAIDRLVQGRGQRPIIVLQGDHGPKSLLNQDALGNSDLDEAFGILNAYYVPEELRSRLYPSISPVNTWRLVLGFLLGTPIPNGPDRSYYAPWSEPLKFVDVSQRLTPALPGRTEAGL